MNYVRSGAIFSPCRTWRYTLARWWEPCGVFANFICLNPSTADETVDDRTVGRCCDFAHRWGYAGMVITNLFAFRSTKPKGLLVAPDPVGPDNDEHILHVARLAGTVVCGWGTWGKINGRGVHVLCLLDRAEIAYFCLGITKAGQPKHPLYLRGDTIRRALQSGESLP